MKVNKNMHAKRWLRDDTIRLKELVEIGLTSKEIANELDFSEGTVIYQISRLKEQSETDD